MYRWLARLVVRRLRAVFRKDVLESELEHELQFHLDKEIEQNLARGMTVPQARNAALARFGGVEQVKEQLRHARGVQLFEEAWLDLRHALRMLGKSPGFSAAALVTLAVGIGACVAIVSVVDSVLLRPLAYPHFDRLVVVHESLLPQLPEFAVSPHHYFAWKRQTTSFASLAAHHQGSYNLTGRGAPLRVSAGRVTANTFATLGVAPALGRDFSPREDVPGSANVAILGHGFWLRQFGGRPDILQQTIALDGRPFTVIGVMPKGFALDGPLDLFTPAAYGESSVHDIGAIGRLQDSVTLAQARGEMALIAARLARQDPHNHKGWGVQLTPLLEFQVRDVRPVLLSLLGAVGFLLLLACANVANLLLARATARAREIAVRVALGASRGRIVRQLLTESLLLALLAGLLGLLIAEAGISALLALAPENLPHAAAIALDARVLGITCALALLTGVGFGLVPAFQGARVQLHDALKRGGRGTGQGRPQQRLRGALVITQVAIALILLVGAGLLIRSFQRLQDVNPGFRPEGALAVTLSLPATKYPQGPQQAAFAEKAVARMAALAGVEAVGASQGFLFAGRFDFAFLKIAGRPVLPRNQAPRANVFCVTGDYFRALGIPLLRGRLLDARDGANATRVAVINQTMARQFFPGEDPIGKRLAAVNRDNWAEIVGVVGDARPDRLDREVAPQAYGPLAQVQADWGALTFIVRGSGALPGLPAAIRAAIQSVDSGQAVTSIRPLTEVVASSLARQRFTMWLFGLFSAAALLLAAIGIYAVMAYTVSQRTGELGIRMALGAQVGDVLRLVFRQAGRLVALGLGAGGIAALLLTRLMTTLLFGVSPYDPLTFIVIALLLGLVAVVACIIPARRATRIDPMVALRAE